MSSIIIYFMLAMLLIGLCMAWHSAITDIRERSSRASKTKHHNTKH